MRAFLMQSQGKTPKALRARAVARQPHAGNIGK